MYLWVCVVSILIKCVIYWKTNDTDNINIKQNIIT